MKTDARIDATISAIHGAVQSLSSLPGATGDAARTVLRRAFGRGVAHIVHQSHAEQEFTVGGLVELFEGELASAIDALSLTEAVAELKEANAAMRRLLDAEKDRGVLWADVVEAQRKGQELMLETVALIVAAYPRADAEQSEKRARLLRPILEHNEQIRQWRKRHATAVDVDPVSGEVVVDAPAPADADEEPVEG